MSQHDVADGFVDATSKPDSAPGPAAPTPRVVRRNTTISVDSASFPPISPGFYRLPIHGNCPKCHHYHKAAMIEVSKDLNTKSAVDCKRCGERWLTFGGNSTCISLVSTATTDPDPREIDIRSSLIEMLRSLSAVGSPTALASVPESPDILSRGDSVKSTKPGLDHNSPPAEPTVARYPAPKPAAELFQVAAKAADRPLSSPSLPAGAQIRGGAGSKRRRKAFVAKLRLIKESITGLRLSRLISSRKNKVTDKGKGKQPVEQPKQPRSTHHLPDAPNQPTDTHDCPDHPEPAAHSPPRSSVIYSERSDEDRQKDEQKMKDCQKENDPTDSPGKNGHGDNDEELQAVSDSQNARDEMREPSNERTETRPTQRPTGDNFEDIRELLRHMSTDDRISWVRAQITDLKCRCDLDCRCRNVTHRRTSSSNGSGNTEEGTAPSTSLLMLHNLTRGRLSHEFLHTGGPFEDYRPTAHRPPSIVSLRTSRAPTLLGSDGLTVASSAPRLSIRGLAAAQRGRSRSASRLRQNVSQDDISNAESRRTSSTGARVRVLAGAREENGNHTSPAGSRQASDNASTASGQQNEERAPSTASTHHLNGYRTSDERNRDSPSPPLQGPST